MDLGNETLKDTIEHHVMKIKHSIDDNNAERQSEDKAIQQLLTEHYDNWIADLKAKILDKEIAETRALYEQDARERFMVHKGNYNKWWGFATARLELEENLTEQLNCDTLYSEETLYETMAKKAKEIGNSRWHWGDKRRKQEHEFTDTEVVGGHRLMIKVLNKVFDARNNTPTAQREDIDRDTNRIITFLERFDTKSKEEHSFHKHEDAAYLTDIVAETLAESTVTIDELVGDRNTLQLLNRLCNNNTSWNGKKRVAVNYLRNNNNTLEQMMIETTSKKDAEYKKRVAKWWTLAIVKEI